METNAKNIDIDSIEVGSILKEPIMDDRTGALLVAAGTIVNKSIKEKLKNIGITTIEAELITTKTQDDNDNKIVSENLRNKTVQTLTKAQEQILHGGSANMVGILENAKELTSFVLENNNSGNDLTSYLYKKDVISHAERVSRYAVNLARIYNNRRIEIAKSKLQPNMRLEKLKEVIKSFQAELIDLEALSIAALFHDIGINCKDKRATLEQIKNKRKVLEYLKSVYPAIDDSIFDEYKQEFSSVYSYFLMSDIVFPKEKKKKGFSSDVKRMIFYSGEGETSDKSPINVPTEMLKQRIGYIYGAKVIHLCDLYDKQLTRAIDSKIPFEEIVSLLGYYGQNGFVNNELEMDFITHFPFYPEGTLVRLSNGLNAVVVGERTGHTFACRPIVRLSGTNQLVDLAEDNSITILYIIPNLKYCDDKEIFQNLVNDQISSLQNVYNGKDKQMRKTIYRTRS